MLAKILIWVNLIALAAKLIGWLRTRRQPPDNTDQPRGDATT